MVKNIVRVKNDFFNYALTWLIFKNKFFLLAIRLVILALFVAALTYGFLNPSPRTFHFNVGIFWVETYKGTFFPMRFKSSLNPS